MSLRAELLRLGIRLFLKRRGHHLDIDIWRKNMRAMERLLPRPPARARTIEVRAGELTFHQVTTQASLPERSYPGIRVSTQCARLVDLGCDSKDGTPGLDAVARLRQMEQMFDLETKDSVRLLQVSKDKIEPAIRDGTGAPERRDQQEDRRARGNRAARPAAAGHRAA